MIPVTVIAGPPCSGKSTLAQQLAQAGDQVIDFDLIAVELGSGHPWAHSSSTRHAAGVELARRVRLLHGATGGRAYLIRTAPEARTREQLAQDLGAVVWVLNPGLVECLRRAQADRRPRGTGQAVRLWYARYQPSDVDERCPYVEPVQGEAPTTSRAW